MDSENNIMSVNFHWSTEVIIITIVSLCIVIGCIIPVFLSKAVPIYLKWIIGVVVIVPVLYCSTWTPISLSVKDNRIVLKKLIGTITIPAHEITTFKPIETRALNESIRTFGSGGAFGYLGRFKNSTLGNYTMYITEKKNLLLIGTKEKTYVFNCKYPDEFLKAMKRD